MDTYDFKPTIGNSSPNVAVNNAVAILNEMNSVEVILQEFEQNAATEEDVLMKIDQLTTLNRWYLKRFGVPFEIRLEFRRQLVGVVAGNNKPVSEATQLAGSNYNRVHGKGLPRMLQLIVNSTRDRVLSTF